MLRLAPLAALAAVLALAAGCGGSGGEEPAGDGLETAVTPGPIDTREGGWVEEGGLDDRGPTPVACKAGQRKRLRTPASAYAGVVLRNGTAVYARPGGKRLATLDTVNQNGIPMVLGVLGAVLGRDCAPAWYRVQLPLRPNGASGFVRAKRLRLERVDARIEVDLGSRLIELYVGGERVLRTRTAIGTPSTPTPTGSFYVNQKFLVEDSWGPFGPAAIGISAFSPVLIDWSQGGPIAIHGTNQPDSIGKPASNGCLRVPNDVAEQILALAPLGTPVEIRA